MFAQPRKRCWEQHPCSFCYSVKSLGRDHRPVKVVHAGASSLNSKCMWDYAHTIAAAALAAAAHAAGDAAHVKQACRPVVAARQQQVAVHWTHMHRVHLQRQRGTNPSNCTMTQHA